MKFYRNHWYYVGGILFVALSFLMGLWGVNHVSPIQAILIYSFMALLVHQFEEYALPGGFPPILNMAMMSILLRIGSDKTGHRGIAG